MCAQTIPAGTRPSCTGTTGTGPVEASTSEGRRNWLTHSIIGHAGELLRELLVHRVVVQSRLGLGAAELGPASHLAQGVNRFARQGLVTNGLGVRV